MSKYLTEVLGTFFLVLAAGLAGLLASPVAPLAVGLTLMVMVYMGGHISGGHYNPAVSLGALLARKMDQRDFIPYVVCQLVGAVVAAVVVSVVMGRTSPIAPGKNALGEQVHVLAALLVEFLFTFALVLVVLNVATSKKTQGNSYYGLAIGLTIGAAAVLGGPLSGGAFNPAVGTGLVLVDGIARSSDAFMNLWIYLVGPLAGGALAAYVFKMQEENW